jgi:hypothetical protein
VNGFRNRCRFRLGDMRLGLRFGHRLRFLGSGSGFGFGFPVWVKV